MLGGMAAKWRWRAKRRGGRASRPTRPTWCAGRCRWSGTSSPATGTSRCGRSPCPRAATSMDVEQMLERVDENTIMVVPTFGVTYTGSYEPVLELSQALDKLQEETGLDIDIHVDGASGAFLAPFCAPDIVWDFRVPRVKSISTSGHKFGLAPARGGLGAVAGRGGAARRPDLPRHLPRRGHAGVPDQLLPARRPDRGAVLQLRAARPGRLPQRARRLLRHRQVPGRGGGQARPVRAAVRLRTRRRGSRRWPGGSGRARTRATRSTTSPTGCGPGAGRCRPTR